MKGDFMTDLIEKVLKKTSYFKKLEDDIDSLRSQKDVVEQQLESMEAELNFYKSMQFFPPGHFYSPIVHQDEITPYNVTYAKIFPAVDLNEEQQLFLLSEFKEYYLDLPFEEKKKLDLRYYFDNEAYSYADGIILYCMIRKFKPKKIIEIGSGYSSCVTLDTNELFFENKIKCSFIEPYPVLLKSLLKEEDFQNINLLETKVQNVPLRIFQELKAGDILFIDSTHVAKVNSDVNYIFFNILPNLAKGVLIHFHDIFYPFEYPEKWIREGRNWNEIYLLRAFLEYNNVFSIQFFNSYMAQFHIDKFQRYLPLYVKNTGGAIWLEKTQ